MSRKFLAGVETNALKLTAGAGTAGYVPVADAAGNLTLTQTPNWDIDSTSPATVQRLRFSTFNFLANADFEAWNNGTSVAPPGWAISGGVTIARAAALSVGTYCAQLTFDATNTGIFFQNIPSSTAVDYTYTVYVQRTSGTGTANLVARNADSLGTVFASVALNVTGGIGLAAITLKPSAGANLRFSIEASSAAASTWLVDEAMLQEAKGIATAYARPYIDDSTAQSIFGVKTFAGGQFTYNGGFKLYDTTGANSTLFNASGSAGGSDKTLNYPVVNDTLVARATPDTLTNKRVTKRVLALSAGSATPAINTDNFDVVNITAQSAAITSFTSSLTGTPVDGDTLRISITDNATARAITWGTSFESSTVTLPTTTVVSTRLDIGFFWNTATSKWRCVAVA